MAQHTFNGFRVRQQAPGEYAVTNDEAPFVREVVRLVADAQMSRCSCLVWRTFLPPDQQCAHRQAVAAYLASKEAPMNN